jgi:hypothetical protein
MPARSLRCCPPFCSLFRTLQSRLAPRRSSIYEDIREGLKFVWTSPGTRRLTIMGMIFMFLAAPLQGLLPVFAQSVLKGGPGLVRPDALSDRPGFDSYAFQIGVYSPNRKSATDAVVPL